MLILNLKNYPTAVGPGQVDKFLEAVAVFRAESPDIAAEVLIAPSIYDLSYSVSKLNPMYVAAPHVDFSKMGSTTGWVPPQALLDMGIRYAVVNHSEHRIWSDDIVARLLGVQDLGLKLIVCCESLEEAELLLDARPFAIAYEDKDLIGTGQAIAAEQPERVRQFVDRVQNYTIPIVGAGISSGADIEVGAKLGAKGFILASAFVKAEDPLAKLRELSEVWQKSRLA